MTCLAVALAKQSKVEPQIGTDPVALWFFQKLLAMTKTSQNSTYHPVNGYFFDFFLSVLDIGQANENSGGTAAA